MFSNAHRRGCTKPLPDEGTRVATLRGQPADLLFADDLRIEMPSARQVAKTDILHADRIVLVAVFLSAIRCADVTDTSV